MRRGPTVAQYVKKGSQNLFALLTGNDLQAQLREMEEEKVRAEQQAENVIRTLIGRHYTDRDVPPPDLRLNVGRWDSALNYWTKGISSSERVLSIFGEVPDGPILDWGCGSGRTRLWLLHLPAWREAYHGCDVDTRAIEWLKAQGERRVQPCGDEPPLDYPDGFFIGLFSFSVLTHIPPERHRAWYAELGRVLKRGALACITVNGSVDGLGLSEPQQTEFRRTGHVFETTKGHYKHVSCVREDFTRQCLDGLLEVERYEVNGYGPQDLIVARRP